MFFWIKILNKKATTIHQASWPQEPTNTWRILKKHTRCAWAGGSFFPVVPLCQFFVMSGNCFRCYLPIIPVVLLCPFFWLRREIGFGCTGQFFGCGGNCFRCCLLTYHTSCAIVSVFWLRQEIVFGCTVYKKDSYLLSLIGRETTSKCVYFVRWNTLLLCNYLLCIYLLYRTDPHTAYFFLALYGSTTLQSLSFLKNIKNFLSK